MLTVPRAASRHVIKSSAEYMATVAAAMTLHELGWVANVIAHHTQSIGVCFVLKEEVVFDDHGWVNLSDLSFFLDGIGVDDFACHQVSQELHQCKPIYQIRRDTLEHPGVSRTTSGLSFSVVRSNAIVHRKAKGLSNGVRAVLHTSDPGTELDHVEVRSTYGTAICAFYPWFQTLVV